MHSNRLLLLPPEMKGRIMSHLELPAILRLGQTCQNLYPSAIQALYQRDAREHNSFAMKWMAARAIDEQTTDLALKALKLSQEFGGEINAIQLDGPLIRRSVYEVSALHWAILTENVRLTEALLDNGANPRIPCAGVLLEALYAEQVRQRIRYFQDVFSGFSFTLVFPIFLAFLQRDPNTFELLLNHEAGPEAVINYDQSDDAIRRCISILHFAAADNAPDFGQLERLFDTFREHINQRCTRANLTPLHVALMNGCTRGMKIAVHTGAEKEARDAYLLTPLVMGVQELQYLPADAETFREHTRCLREFVNLGGSLNSANGSLSAPGHLHGEDNVVPHRQADLDNGTHWSNSNVANELILAVLPMEENHPGLMILWKLLLDFVDQGLIFAEPAFWLPSPLHLVMFNREDAQSDSLFALLTEMQANIHVEEAGDFFLGWCETLLCHATEAAWWQHIESISDATVSAAYTIAFSQATYKLYYMLMRMPLAAPPSDLLVEAAFASKKKWSWRITLAREFEDDFLASTLFNGDGILHLTVRFYTTVPDYSAAEAIQDISRLVAGGANITLQNGDRHNPLQLLVASHSNKEDLPELGAYLETLLSMARDLRIRS